jgi:nitrite reductase/ring-hydroxylating ferredoxin subunit
VSDWTRVASTTDLKNGGMIQVQVNDEPVCLACTTEGEFLATSDICSHEYVLLHDGFLEGDEVECPEHGSMFSMRTGEVMNLPATQPIGVYEVRIEGEDIYLKVREEANA